MNRQSAGVTKSYHKDGSLYFRSSVTHNRKHISLGAFDDEETAHRAYNQARLLLRDPDVGILDFHEPSALSFEKWVCLVNFRDNGIYIANPIYIMRKMFYYYLSTEDILKFDADELFYYTSHKIMRRGGHYFVADYGNQINIVNRYGIRSYAVEGRDYLFRNGDILDFRAANLQIINRYIGVTREIKKGRVIFRTRIHINGNFIVGDYDTETEAAIAYNKAVDTLQAQGLKKNYGKNYLEDMEAEEYARIYEKLELSEKIRKLNRE